MTAVSSSAAFLTANQEAASASDAAPGVLQIGSRLRLANIANGLGLVDTFPETERSSITSGPPDAFSVTIVRMQLIPTKRDSDAKVVTLSDSPITIDVDSGEVNLTNLGVLASGTSIPAGQYRSLIVDFSRRAMVRGCVTGKFSTMYTVQGYQTYCTRTGYSQFDSVAATNADFQGITASDMELDLGGKGGVEDVVTMEFSLADGITIADNETTTLSMVFDLNRMLRYYNMNRPDTGPNPGMPTDRAYFFTTVFGSSVYAFVGKPGRIYGYELVAEAASDLHPDPTHESSWLTIITDNEGQLIMAGLMPDDDNGLTIMKGAIRPEGMAAGTSAGTVNLTYSLGQSPLGTLLGFASILDDTAVGAQMSGVTFESQHSTQGLYTGPVFVRRGL